MTDKTAKGDQDKRSLVLLGLGIWLFISPGFLHFNTVEGATGNTAAIGALLCVLGGIAMRMPRPWVLWSIGGVGVWLAASPWALGFPGEAAPLWNSVIGGLLMVVLSLWIIFAPEFMRAKAPATANQA